MPTEGKSHCVLAKIVWWTQGSCNQLCYMLEIFSIKQERLYQDRTSTWSRDPNWTLEKACYRLLTYDSANFLLVVDYTTKFPVVCKLTDLTAHVVTEHMKAIFSKFGTPHSIVSDNGPCYAAQYFADAMAEWGVSHIKVSPHHHQANGLAEGYVRIVKQLLTKEKESGHDPNKAIAIYRTSLCQTNYQCRSSCCMAGDLKQISHSTQCLIQIRSWHYDTRTKMRQNQRSTSLWELMLFTTPLNKKWYPTVIEEYLGTDPTKSEHQIMHNMCTHGIIWNHMCQALWKQHQKLRKTKPVTVQMYMSQHA